MTPITPVSRRTHHAQRGVALITILVILLLSIIAVLAAGRSGLLNEALVGNETDYGRTLAAAEALLRDAEVDIRGRFPNGFLCRTSPVGTGDVDSDPNFTGCRNTSIATNAFFPTLESELAEVRTIVLAASPAPAPPCFQGICVPDSLIQLNNPSGSPTFTIEDNLATMAPLGVRYGTFTRADGGATLVGATNINPILRQPPPGPPPAVTAANQGWYWVEIFRYDVGNAMAAGPDATLKPKATAPFIYRITAVALGQKPGTRAVLKSFYVVQ
jgi:type IV pilus assembly protein PilX